MPLNNVGQGGEGTNEASEKMGKASDEGQGSIVFEMNREVPH